MSSITQSADYSSLKPTTMNVAEKLMQDVTTVSDDFLPRDARSASGLSVCLSVCPSVTLRYAEHIGWTSSKLITRIISLGSSLLAATTSAI